ncbi:MAG: MFS transporter [bacterium]|nr:MFS transporter [bacterium]
MQVSLAISVLILTFSRIIINMTRRFALPFLPILARHLGVPLASVQSVVALQAGIGVTSPAFGPLAERYGRKRVMLGALALVLVSALVMVAAPRFTVFAIVMIVFGVGKMIFDPAMYAYLGDRVPYNRRGMAMGATELSWASALLVAGPLVGFLLGFSALVVPAVLLRGEARFIPSFPYANDGLQAVFLALAIISLTAMLAVSLLLPGDAPQKGVVRSRPINPLAALRILSQSPMGMGAIGYTLALTMANEIFYINYGVWMEQTFQLGPARLGVLTTVIAAAEVIGEFFVIGLSDRIGKRRMALAAALVASIGYIAMPLLSFSLVTALLGLFVAFLAFETAIVSSIPLFTEIMPDTRAVMMSGSVGAGAVGRFTGTAVGSIVFAWTNSFLLIGIVAAVVGLLAFASMARYVQERA